MGWHVERLSPADVVQRKQPHKVRVELGDGSREVLYEPEVQGDSLLGRSDSSAGQPDRALLLTNVKEVATRHISGQRTAALVAGVGVIVSMIVWFKNNCCPINLGGLGQ